MFFTVGFVSKIYRIRDIKVMSDRDLTELYEVEIRTLKQAVRRNIERFPSDFMFGEPGNRQNEKAGALEYGLPLCIMHTVGGLIPYIQL
jgi:hypothetical protein